MLCMHLVRSIACKPWSTYDPAVYSQSIHGFTTLCCINLLKICTHTHTHTHTHLYTHTHTYTHKNMYAKSLEKVKVLESSLQESVNKKAHHEQSKLTKEIRILQEV